MTELGSRPVPARRPVVVLTLGALGLLVLSAAALLAWRQLAAHDDAATAAALAPAPLRPPANTAPPVTPARPQAPALPASDEPPLQTQIERLLATHDPHDAYHAYLLVANCAAFNANGDRLIFDQEELKRWKGDSLPGFRGMNDAEKRHDAKLCGGMTERDRQNRLDYLAIAARAGVPGAAVDFLSEGPFGDRSALQTRPDDPLVQEWKAAARAQLSQAAESGIDLGALQLLGNANQGGTDVVDKNPALAYRYLVATGLVYGDMAGADHPLAQLYARDGKVADEAGAGLTPEQRAAELAAAQAIAARARAARKRGD